MYLASLHPPGVLFHPEVLVPQGLPGRLSRLDFLEAPFHLLCLEHLHNGSTLISLAFCNNCEIYCVLISKIFTGITERMD